MKAKWMKVSVGLMALAVYLVTGFQPASAAPPTGEVKTVGAVFGNQVPIPYLETSNANDWIHLLYDSLVACTPDGKIRPPGFTSMR